MEYAIEGGGGVCVEVFAFEDEELFWGIVFSPTIELLQVESSGEIAVVAVVVALVGGIC